MSDSTTEILDPDQPVTLRDGTQITVREMNWKAAKAFLGQLAARASEFLTISPTGSTDLDTGRLVNLIVTDLGEALLLATTTLTKEQVESLSLRDMLTLLDLAVALNLRPEMIEAGKAVAGRFKALAKK